MKKYLLNSKLRYLLIMTIVFTFCNIYVLTEYLKDTKNNQSLIFPIIAFSCFIVLFIYAIIDENKKLK